MKDTVIKGDGTSRTLKAPASMPETFEEWRSQLLAGNATMDIGLNSDGCTVVGTAMSKANLLSDTTKAALELSQSDPTVNDALYSLSGKSNLTTEIGTSDIWTYVKYSNGIAECWGTYTGTVSLSKSLDSVHYSNRINANYPFNFASAPVFTVSGGSNNHMNWARKFAQTLIDRASFVVVGLTAQTNVDVYVNIHAIGKWK